MSPIDHRMIELALEKVDSQNFEKFAHAFFAGMIGPGYVPLGGVHDGGADGVVDQSPYGNATGKKFLQASITSNPSARQKIRDTMKRLRDVGREVASLIYCTNRNVNRIDIIEDELSDEFDCRITIRDAAYFTHHANDSPQTVQACKSYLFPAVSYLQEIGSADIVRDSNKLPTKTLCVFVGQEVERRRGQTQLFEAVIDSLIIWSLEGTDPDENKFRTREEIEEHVIAAMPSARDFFREALNARLEALRSKSDGGRRINFHAPVSGYCLPYETRELIKAENIKDETLKGSVTQMFRQKTSEEIQALRERDPEGTADAVNDQNLIEIAVEICHDTIHRLFLGQGLELSLFLADSRNMDPPSVEGYMDSAIQGKNLANCEAYVVASAVMRCLRRAFYDSSREERIYLAKLSRTYVLMFLLNNEPRIADFLRAMKSQFQLYVGADILVRCLSEHMLAPENQMTKNALKIMQKSGSTLVLTHKAVDEVWHHVKNSNYEYKYNYLEFTQYMKHDIARQIGKILIRAFFYARFKNQGSRGPSLTWESYLSKFFTYSDIEKESARDELREYLINEFNMKFETEEETLSELDESEIDSLAEKILNARGKTDREGASEKILCQNAAATVLRIYKKREADSERVGSNPYGFKTWWMTQQTRIRDATGALVDQKGAQYMMRPEFILHFLAKIPDKHDVIKSYEEVFPSILGIRLGNRMNEEAFKALIEKAKGVFDATDDSRARVVLAKGATDLQSNFRKKYEPGHSS